ncbi:AEC family transporter [Xylella fastidiosa subsp. multiplex]|uniref:AEC family transporter n=1 Tax=Xylella fastidiosa subsp. multiplex TaxID=644357 RepID=A0A9Q4MFZ2_XYLFS|nr:AEC family transporter [Xylella fastidiosa]ERI59193.1 transporter [Xylella fastidiosa subsp. multiplex Griffin-1]ACA11924.1 conserved hypothetical protein [Xylella fastidiosa M12]KAJ4852812.1 AEC family transporter [Xylella fastidiosa subsp. multiplex]KFA40789.1 hypothetical protein DF22_002622 [Xylella fastidiosa]MBE0269822.1 AEC family transporter [Xylella fastidiosa subsp. multiplex]
MFYDVFLRVSLLIIISIIGIIVGKKFRLDSKDISSLLVYVISPFVIFYSILQSPANLQYLKYSLAAFIVTSCMGLLGLFFASFFWKDSRKNLFGFAAGTGNSGYFALPLVLAIFNQNQIAIAIFIIIGVNLYEFTLGYFITAKGTMTYKDSLIKVIKMPIIYAATLGILLKYMDISLNDITLSFLSNFKGAYSVLGMMTIGITISKFSKIEFDAKFSILSIFWKHIIYPLFGLLVFIYIIPVEKDTLKIIALMVAIPMAGNVVIISNNLGLHPEKAAATVMISTLFALATVPLSLYLAISF